MPSRERRVLLDASGSAQTLGERPARRRLLAALLVVGLLTLACGGGALAGKGTAVKTE